MTGITILALYVAAGILLARGMLNGENSNTIGFRIALLTGWIGFAVQTFAILRPLITDDRWTLGLFDTASLIGWLIALIALLGTLRRPLQGLAAMLLVIAGLLSAGTGFSAAGPTITSGWQIKSHIILSIFAYTLLSITTALAVLMAWQERRLKQKHPGGMLRLLPPLETMELTLFGTMATGWLVLSLAIFSGLIFVEDLLGQHLSHKTVFSILAWVVFALVLFGHWRFGWRGQKAVTWTIAGFASLVLAYFGSKLVLEVLLNRHWG